MLFVIHCVDGPERTSLRAKTFDAHQAHLAVRTVRLIVAGPLLSDDGSASVGSFLLVEAETRDEAVTFAHNDPFYKAGVWETVQIHHFDKRWDDRV